MILCRYWGKRSTSPPDCFTPRVVTLLDPRNSLDVVAKSLTLPRIYIQLTRPFSLV